MGERFPPPWQMMGPPPGGIWERFPLPGPMMGPQGGGFPPPMMGPRGGGMWRGPMMGHGGPGMWGPMMGPGGGNMWQRFPQQGPMMGPGSFPNPEWMMGPPPGGMPESYPGHNQMTSEGQDDSYSGGRRSRSKTGRRLGRNDSPVSSDSGSASPFRRDSSQIYQEPDSSTSFQGKKSRKKSMEEAEEEEEVDYYVGPYCEVCELHLATEQMLWSHMSGKKHLKALKALDAGRPLPKKVQERKENPSSSSKDEYSSFERAFASLTADEPVVGLGFLVETFDQTEELITCELCDAKCNQNNMVLHVIGLKHRMTYLKKCDPDRYSRLKKQQKRSKLTEDTRQLCKEVESAVGRGRPRCKGPRHTGMERNVSQFERRRLSPEERKMGIEDLRRILMQDFVSRNIDDGTAKEMLEERMALMKEYEKRGVPFDLAKERVIEDEDRWSLLLEFERQSLSFEEAEERISYRMDLLKAYIVNDCPKEEARKNVLDDEVIRDFRKEFQRMGMQREHAQKQVEKRFWMLERLHYKGFSQEEASQKVMKIERELSQLMQSAEEEGEKHKQVSELFSWMKAGEDLETFIENTFYELQLSSAQREKHIKLALDSLDRYRSRDVPVDKAKKKVLVEDLPIPGDETDEEGEEDKKDKQCLPEEPATSSSTRSSSSSSTAGLKHDVIQRVKLFMTKLHALLQIDKQETETVDREKQLAMFDQLSQLEMQSLLSDMCKSDVKAVDAKTSFVDLFQRHENLRKSLFPLLKESDSHERLKAALKMFLRHYNLSKGETNRSSLGESSKHQRERSRSLDRHGHSSRRRDYRSRRRSSSDRSSSGKSPRHSRPRSRSADRQGHSSKMRSRSKSLSTHRPSKKSGTHDERKGIRQSASQRHKRRNRSRERHRSSSPEYG